MHGPEDLSCTTAERLLERMKALGVDYIFGNAGTDFPPIIEALARAPESGLDLPEPVLVAHETAAVGMAHGYWLATGRAQCAMVHVNVGLANALMPLINAAVDNAPILMCSGRTPVTEYGRAGSRSRPIHWGQEMRDQAAMVRETVKWDYELRYPEQAAIVVERALAIAASDPAGPVYLSLPREVLAAAAAATPAPVETRQTPAKAGAPSPQALAQAVALLGAARNPVIVAQRPPAPADFHTLTAFAERLGAPIVDFWAARNVVDSEHPLHGGGDPAAWLAGADVVVAVEALVPWLIEGRNSGGDARIVAVGVDPLFARVPVRSFPVDVALAGDPALTLTALTEGLGPGDGPAIAARRTRIAAAGAERRAAARARAEAGAGSPMSPAWASHCLSEAKDEGAAVFNELGCDASVMRFSRPGTYFSAAISGGLGWALPAALGFQLADRERLTIACVGDGSYIFANPLACHMVAMAQRLPVLTVIFNNGLWQAVRRATLAMYPDGAAARANAMPLTRLSPAPDYAAIARAHGLWAEQVVDGAALPEAIGRALAAIRRDRRPALLDVAVSAG